MKFPKIKLSKKEEVNVSEEKSNKKQPTENVDVQAKSVVQDKKVSPTYPSEDRIKFEPLTAKHYVYKKLVDKKLTIVLIQNTTEVAREREELIKNVRFLLKSSELVSIINYGTSVRQSEIFDVSAFDDSILLCDDDIGDKSCLYDALVTLDDLVCKEYMNIKEEEKERVRINQIDVIGIGTCMDNCSNVSRDLACYCFYQVTSKHNVVTKYLCLTEESFMDAAGIGFRSIGAISKEY